MGIRDRIESSFEDWGHLAFRHPWRTIAVTAVVTLALCSGILQVRTDVSTESYLKKGDPARVVYNAFRAQFGNDEDLQLIVESDALLSLPVLEKLRDLHADLEAEVPSLDEVNSLINARVTRGEGDELIVEDLFERWPETQAELDVIVERIRTNPTYQNLLISEDARFTSLTVRIDPRGEQGAERALDEFDNDGTFEAEFDAGLAGEASPPPATMLQGEELNAVVEAIYAVVARYQSDDFEIVISGGPSLTYELLAIMNRDMALFTGLSNLLIAALLFLLFRRFSGVFLPLIIVALPLAATFGAMGLLDIPITPSTQILPSLLLAVCVGDAVHLLSIFYGKLDHGMGKEEAIAFALGHSGLAVVMTSLTTAGSLFAFAFADLEPLRGLGIAAPIGILFALVYAVVLLPSLIAVCPVRPRVPKGDVGHGGWIERALVALGDFSTQRPWLVVAIWTVLVFGSLYGASQIQFSHAPNKWFPEGHPVRKSLEVANRVFKSALSLEVILDTGRENGLHDPAVLKQMERLHEAARSLENDQVKVGKVISLVDVVKETNQALNENDPGHYTIPDNARLVTQELLLFENAGSDDLEDLVDSQFRTARLAILVPFEDALYYIPFEKDLRALIERTMDETVGVEVTGLVVLYGQTMDAMLTSTAKSYAIALAVIAPLMILLIGSVRMGLLSLIPNIAPIILGMGLMHLLGINLDLFTILIGSIAIGVAVDGTIHFMHNYRRYYEQMGDAALAVHETMQSTGKALMVTSLALSTGFFVFLFATMRHIQGFGLITGFTILAALLANLMLSPALVTLVHRFRKRHEEPSVTEGATRHESTH